MLQNIFLLLSTLIAFFVKGLTGFGNTLVMGSFFSFVVSNRLTTPVDLILGIPTNIYIAWKERKNISLKIVIPLSLMLLIGIIPGTFLLKVGNDWLLKSIFGIVVMGIAVEMLTRKPNNTTNITNTQKRWNKVSLLFIGILSGVLAGLFGIGALLVAYISRTTDNKNQFRANICCVFLVDNVFRFFLYLYTGILNLQVLFYALLLSPAVIIGMKLGLKANNNMKESSVKKAIIITLMISGGILCIKSVLNR